MLRLNLIFVLLSLALQAQCQTPTTDERNDVKVGAWYFGGWSVTPDKDGHTFHISPTLTSQYAYRSPIWGWREDSPQIMEQQIDYAADAGLDFWGICWYETGVRKEKVFEELNTVFNLFRKAPNRHRLEYFLLSCQPVSPQTWDAYCEKAIDMFKDENYMRVDGRAVMCFFNSQQVINDLGGEKATNSALEHFRAKAKQAGADDVIFGAVVPCQGDTTLQAQFRRSGFEFMTTYNNSDVGREKPGENDYANLMKGDKKSWDVLSSVADYMGMQYLPSMTVGYDMRPWGIDHPTLPKSDYWYTGETPERMAEQLRNIITWVRANQQTVLGGNLSVIYAWNENGEGGWLTPTLKEGNARLKAIKEVIETEKNKK